MTLHEAIIRLLEERDHSMTTSEIASELNKLGWYVKRDKSEITAYQIHGRTKNYPQYFDRDGSTVSLTSDKTMESNQFLICCPNCKTQSNVSISEFKQFVTLKCAACGSEFNNPLNDQCRGNLNNKKNIIGGIVVFVLILMLIGWLSGNGDSINSIYYANKLTFGTTSKEVYDDLGVYSINNDLQAIQSMINCGEIVRITSGTRLNLLSAHFSYSVVTRIGDTQKLWVVTESITKE